MGRAVYDIDQTPGTSGPTPAVRSSPIAIHDFNRFRALSLINSTWVWVKRDAINSATADMTSKPSAVSFNSNSLEFLRVDGDQARILGTKGPQGIDVGIDQAAAHPMARPALTTSTAVA